MVRVLLKTMKYMLSTVLIVSAIVVIALLLPMVLGYKLVGIETGSMEPVLHVGSLCFVKEASIIHENDIVTYYTGDDNDVLVTHRVIGVNMDGTYELKGDNSNMVDLNKVTDENIMGVTRYNVPYGGYFIKYISTVSGKVITSIFLLVLSAIIAVIDHLLDRQKVKEKSKSSINLKD